MFNKEKSLVKQLEKIKLHLDLIRGIELGQKIGKTTLAEYPKFDILKKTYVYSFTSKSSEELINLQSIGSCAVHITLVHSFLLVVHHAPEHSFSKGGFRDLPQNESKTLGIQLKG